MLKELPWARCPKCEQSGYLTGDGCLRCGWHNDDDILGSVTGNGTIVQYNGGLPSNRNNPEGVADMERHSISYYCFNNDYSFYEIDHILRLELGEAFTRKIFVPAAGCYEIITWIKTVN